MLFRSPRGETRPIPPQAKPFRCTPDYPLKVSIWNRGHSPIQDVTVGVTGNAAGMTLAIVDEPFLRIPRIIDPKRGWYQCFGMSVAPGVGLGELRYKAEVVDASYARIQ